jgi:NADH dehydrogenase
MEGAKALFGESTTRPRKLFVGNKRILILGSGFGGTYVFRHLLPSLNRNENVETTMVSDENFFLFTPLLHEVAMGKIETRHIAFPIRRLHWKDRFNFIQDKVQHIDLDARKVFTSQGTFEYDYLVMALGSVTDRLKSTSLSDYTFTLKTLHDSMLIRNHLIGMFERAAAENDPEKRKRLLTFVVCGAGYTGIQVVTELADFVYKHLTKFYRSINVDNIKIILIEAETKILTGLPTELSAYALRQLQRMNIELCLNSRVTDIHDFYVVVNGAERIYTNTLLWVAGIVANPRIAELNVERDGLGRVSVNRFLEVSGSPGVYAIGDCAHFDNLKTGQAIPPRAHTTVRQAKVVP